MEWNKHYELEGMHAFLGASKYHWINYDEEKIISSYTKFLSVEKGTRLHALASELIHMGIKLPRTRQTLNAFVNDAIGYKMESEQILYYSPNAFGTADAISFKKNVLRIHDLKTGETPASMHQLEVYAALFCLEYGIKPSDIDIELRIYQLDDVIVSYPTSEEIVPIMDKIISFDKIITKIQEEEG